VHLPQWSFWSELVYNRLYLAEIGPDAPGEMFSRFVKQATVLSCNENFDPRRGDEKALNFLHEVKRNPTIFIPKPPFPWLQEGTCSCKNGGGNTKTHTWDDDLFCFECFSCHQYAYYNLMELAWWSRWLRGNRTYGGSLCWDQAPPIGTDPMGAWSKDKFNPFPEVPHPYGWDLCLEHPITLTNITEYFCTAKTGRVAVPPAAKPQLAITHLRLPRFPVEVRQFNDAVFPVAGNVWRQAWKAALTASREVEDELSNSSADNF